MNRAARIMRERKWTFAMSIEGQRSRDGSLSPYKKGAAVLAIAAKARIVPFIVRGARDALPFGEWRVAPQALRVISLTAIDTRGMSMNDRDALTARLRSLAERALAHVER
jgi:1-acyl-sn-glycerol-3-phosphate acyltransferase